MLANIVIVVHLAFFAFVVAGFVATIVGAIREWSGRPTWVRNPWFRMIHFAAVLIVLVEDVFGWRCPLNVLESRLRTPVSAAAGEADSTSRLLDYLLHHTLSEKTLDVLYWVIGVTLLVLLVAVPPQFRRVR